MFNHEQKLTNYPKARLTKVLLMSLFVKKVTNDCSRVDSSITVCIVFCVYCARILSVLL